MNDALAPVVSDIWRLVLPVAAFTIIVGTTLLLFIRKLETFLRRRQRMARQRQIIASENAVRAEVVPPDCPLCNRPMVQRNPEPGTSSTKSLWSCSSYPDCRGTREIA
jgi:hypothetical protein